MRLNLGCGALPLEGYVNVDLYNDAADKKGDIREMDFWAITEVNMSHVLEHIPWGDTLPLLERIRSWMVDGGEITVEVPDMARIMAEASPHLEWVVYVYGCQEHQGEFHYSGFTEPMLRTALQKAGFVRVSTKTFLSTHDGRQGMPCLEAVAVA